MRPPFLPAEALRRVLRVSRFDGMTVLTVAGAFAFFSALDHDELGTLIGLAVAGAGAVELHGAALLRYGYLRGMRWLIAAQLLLLLSVCGFAGWRLVQIDGDTLRLFTEVAMTSATRARLPALGVSEAGFMLIYYRSVFAILGVGTLLYQGGMIVYYWQRRLAVTAALTAEE
jgi:hypothetical protein